MILDSQGGLDLLDIWNSATSFFIDEYLEEGVIFGDSFLIQYTGSDNCDSDFCACTETITVDPTSFNYDYGLMF